MEPHFLMVSTSLVFIAAGGLLNLHSRGGISELRIRAFSGSVLLLVIALSFGSILWLRWSGHSLNTLWQTHQLPWTALALSLMYCGCAWSFGLSERCDWVTLFVTCGLLIWLSRAHDFVDQLTGLFALGILRIVHDRSNWAVNTLSLACLSGGYLLLGSFVQWPEGLVDREAFAFVLIITSLGWITRWFPVPRLSRNRLSKHIWSLAGEQVLPLLIVPVVLSQLLPSLLRNDIDLAPLMPAVLLPLALAAVRTAGTTRIADVLALSALVPVAAGLAAIRLTLWDQQQPNYSLQAARPLLTGETLLPLILAEFSCSWLLCVSALQMWSDRPTFGQDGTVSCARPTSLRQRIGRLLAIVGLLSLAGMPPFPGYWWRLLLLTGLTVPHSRSRLTQLYETVPANLIFGVLLAGGLFLMAFALLSLLRQTASAADDEHNAA